MRTSMIAFLLVVMTYQQVEAGEDIDIMPHPTKAGYHCLSPVFFEEGIGEFSDCIGGEVVLGGSRKVEPHPVLIGYSCISSKFLNEIITELEICMEK